MSCRLIPRGEDSFSAQCDCSGDWVDLEAVDRADCGFWSWNLRHAWAGHVLTCLGCSRSYSLGGRLLELGLPDLIDLEELDQIERLELTRVQRRLLNVSITAEDILWERTMILVREAQADANPARAEELTRWALSIRSRAQHEKRETVEAILEELGLEVDQVAQLRLTRDARGGGILYALDRGQLPSRAKVLEPEPVRALDLSDYMGPDQLEDEQLAAASRFEVLDLD